MLCRKLIGRSFYLRCLLGTVWITSTYLILLSSKHYKEQSYESSTIHADTNIDTYNNHKHKDNKNSHEDHSCTFKPHTDKFILNYKPLSSIEHPPNVKRVQPTLERIRQLLETIRSKENNYQPLLKSFDVFDMTDLNQSLKPYTDESNIDEIKTLYNRYFKLMSDKKTIQIDPTFINYLKQISSYLTDGLRNNPTNRYPVQCLRKPVFVLACDQGFFDILQGAIHTLDDYWPDNRIVFYDLGISGDQENLLRTKCPRCTIIKFPFTSIRKFAPHIDTLKNYAFKAFVIQDALRRYGTIIYGDSSARFNSNSFNPVLADNYIRGFAARELPGHSLSCYTKTGTFTWFNQSSTQYDDIYMAEANFLAITDTFLSRLIMKAWLTCSLEPDCLIASQSQTTCKGLQSSLHRYDQSAMVIILTHFFFQGTESSWGSEKVNEPAPYDMFTSVQINLGDIRRGESEWNYLPKKKDFLKT